MSDRSFLISAKYGIINAEYWEISGDYFPILGFFFPLFAFFHSKSLLFDKKIISLHVETMEQKTLIAGPCVIESAELLDTVAKELVSINQEMGCNIIFKASFDKANRTSIHSFRGPGLEKGLQMLADVKARYGLRLLTDIHESWQAAPVSEVCDGNDMRYPVEKARDAGAKEVWLTERGNMMGYNNLVVDFRNIADMLELVPTVIMDCTHSVQRPGGAGGKTGGDRRFVPAMAKAAKAFGATGYFFEVHPDPDRGLSDAANMLELHKLEALVSELL